MALNVMTCERVVDVRCVYLAAVLVMLLTPAQLAPQNGVSQSGAEARYRRVCYYTNWSQYRKNGARFLPANIDPFLCTHIVFAFAKVDPKGRLAPYEWNDIQYPYLYRQFTSLKKKNPRLKALLAVGGWTLGSGPFSRMVASKEARRGFVDHTLQYLRTHGFDGLDLDWEYPANRGSPPEDKDNFSLLLRDLREGFEQEASKTGKPRLLLAAAVAGGERIVRTAYDVPKLDKYLDFISLMSYDLHGSWSKFLGHNAPLYGGDFNTGEKTITHSVNDSVQLWLSLGASRDKLVMGIPFYGRSFTTCGSKVKPGQRNCGVGKAAPYTREKGFVSYYEMLTYLDSGWQRVWLEEEKVPYAFHPETQQWVGYDDLQSIRVKAEYIQQEQLGGAMFWALDLDDFAGLGSDSVYPLARAVRSALTSHENFPQFHAPPVAERKKKKKTVKLSQRQNASSPPARLKRPPKNPKDNVKRLVKDKHKNKNSGKDTGNKNQVDTSGDQNNSKRNQIKTSLETHKNVGKSLNNDVKMAGTKLEMAGGDNDVDPRHRPDTPLSGLSRTLGAARNAINSATKKLSPLTLTSPASSTTTEHRFEQRVTGRREEAQTTLLPTAPVRTDFVKSQPDWPFQKLNDKGRNSRVKETVHTTLKPLQKNAEKMGGSDDDRKLKANRLMKTKVIKTKTSQIVNPFLKFKPMFLTSTYSTTSKTAASIQTTSPATTSPSYSKTTVPNTATDGKNQAPHARQVVNELSAVKTTTQASVVSNLTRRLTPTAQLIYTSTTKPPKTTTTGSSPSTFTKRPALKWWERRHKAKTQTRKTDHAAHAILKVKDMNSVKSSAVSNLNTSPRGTKLDLQRKTSYETKREQVDKSSPMIKHDRAKTTKLSSIYQAELNERQGASRTHKTENDMFEERLVESQEIARDSALTTKPEIDPILVCNSTSSPPSFAESTQTSPSLSTSSATWTPTGSTSAPASTSTKLSITPSARSKWLFELKGKQPSSGSTIEDSGLLTTARTPKKTVNHKPVLEPLNTKATRLNTKNTSRAKLEDGSKPTFTKKENAVWETLRPTTKWRTRTSVLTLGEIITKTPTLSTQHLASSTTITSSSPGTIIVKTVTTSKKPDPKQAHETKILSLNVKPSVGNREGKDRVRGPQPEVSQQNEHKKTEKPAQRRDDQKTEKPTNSIYSGLGLQQDFEAAAGYTEQEGVALSTNLPITASWTQLSDVKSQTGASATTGGKTRPKWLKWSPTNTGTVFPTFTTRHPSPSSTTSTAIPSTTTSTTTATTSTTTTTTLMPSLSTFKTVSTPKPRAQNSWLRWTPGHNDTVFPTFTTKLTRRPTPTTLFAKLSTTNDVTRSQLSSEKAFSDWTDVIDSDEVLTDLTIEAYKNLLRSSTVHATRKQFNTPHTTKADPPPTKQTTKMSGQGSANLISTSQRVNESKTMGVAVPELNWKDAAGEKSSPQRTSPPASSVTDSERTSAEKVMADLDTSLAWKHKPHTPSTKTVEKHRRGNLPRNINVNIKESEGKDTKRDTPRMFSGKAAESSQEESLALKDEKRGKPKILPSGSNLTSRLSIKTVKGDVPQTPSPKANRPHTHTDKPAVSTSVVKLPKTQTPVNPTVTDVTAPGPAWSMLKLIPDTEHRLKDENTNSLWKRLPGKLPRQQEEDPLVRARTKTRHPPNPAARHRGWKHNDGFVIHKDRTVAKNTAVTSTKQLRWWEKHAGPKRAKWWERKPTAEAVMQVYAAKDSRATLRRGQDSAVTTGSPMFQRDVKTTKACDEKNGGQEFKATGTQPESMRAGVEVSYEVRRPDTSAPNFETLPEEKMPVQSEYQPEYQPDFLYDLKHYEEFHCPNAFGIYTDPEDCTRFYQCVWMIAFHHTCGSRTVWNDEMKICDWPTVYSCRT